MSKVNFKQRIRELIQLGFSIIPVKNDKRPKCKWKEFQNRMPTEEDITSWAFYEGEGIAIVTGAISNNLEVIDIDSKYDLTGELTSSIWKAIKDWNPELFDKLVIQETRSGGYHLYYRCKEIEGNLKLANRKATEEEMKNGDSRKVLIETRGESGYVLIDPSPGYKWFQGRPEEIREVTPEERSVLMDIFRSFDKMLKQSVEIPIPKECKVESYGLTPWEDFNESHKVQDLLQSEGWTVVKEDAEKLYMKRPGGTTSVHSGYVYKSSNLFIVFSTSTCFPTNKGLNPAAVYTFLNCDGDFSNAAKKLLAEGFGEQKKRTKRYNKNTEAIPQEIDLSTTPLIPDSVHDSLPTLLKQGVEVFKNGREKDLYLTGVLPIICACFPNWSGLYDDRTVYPAMYSFVIAPAGSGKGAMGYGRNTLLEYHKQLRVEAKERFKEYKLKMQEYDQKRRQGELTDQDEEPEKPKDSMLLIPADLSGASFMQTLYDNDGVGVLFSTEADTLGNIMKQDWGGFSDKLRKAFQHEILEIKRKTNDEYYSIETPKLGIGLSGTTNQLPNMIRAAENGLASRFLYYLFDSPPLFRSVRPRKDRFNYESHFQDLSLKYLSLINYQKGLDFTFDLSDKQWTEMENVFFEKTPEYVLQYGNLFKGFIFRLGLMTYRFAMIFTILDLYDEIGKTANKGNTHYICSDKNFKLAMELFNVYKDHAVISFNLLPSKESKKQNRMIAKFFTILPDDFKRCEALEFGKKMNIKERTVGKYLSVLIDKRLLEKGENNQGYYRKCFLSQK